MAFCMKKVRDVGVGRWTKQRTIISKFICKITERIRMHQMPAYPKSLTSSPSSLQRHHLSSTTRPSTSHQATKPHDTYAIPAAFSLPSKCCLHLPPRPPCAAPPPPPFVPSMATTKPGRWQPFKTLLQPPTLAAFKIKTAFSQISTAVMVQIFRPP